MKRPLAQLALTVAAALCAAWPATQAAATSDFAEAEVLSLDQLNEIRGGLQLPSAPSSALAR